MGKRKTLRQKKLHDMRAHDATHQEPSSIPSSHTISYSFAGAPKQQSTPSVHATVATDVRKTALISLLIIAAQVILFTLLQNHVLALPFVRY